MPGTVSEEEVITNKELIPKTKDKEEVEESKTESKSKSTKKGHKL